MAIRQTFDFENPETGEIVTLNVTSLVSDIRDLFLSKIRNDKDKKQWRQMSENEQQVEIDHAQSMALQIVNSVASIVATANRPVIHALLDNFKVKAGEVTVTAKGLADDGAVLALNHVGKKSLKIVVVDEAQFQEESNEAKPDPDQPDLLEGADEDEGPSLADAMHAAIEADEAASEEETPVDPEPEDQADLTACEQGNGAAAHGLSARANPFKTGSEDYSEWVRGFNDFTPAAPEVEEEPQPETETQELGGEAEPQMDLGDANDEFPGDTPADDEGFNGEDPYQEGVDARIADKGPDENPYDGGTEGWHKWRDGYDKTDGAIERLKEEGRQARRDGAGPRKNPWKAGTPEHGYWSMGYQQAKDEEQD